ncbi:MULTISPECIES: Lrp/AsnC family transcriptional regulator [unclassified Thalassospira]|uniref:Lrp/AsnC family transcriptional regulator n=1 Tax=unclassified Thalassospira TaxID=2648997 RepID=UPI000A1D99B3|nr:Lrp/AsnC family transcriptional regulator [Thalassospira sp. MCCC 1A01428]OSQ42055.1 AsnC family transcriptional regulator [Thalassospira sp. MCCC 1A01428]
MARNGFDAIDRNILREIQEDGRISMVELADKVGLSVSPCLRRLRKLEESGVIRKYVALLDPSHLHLGVNVFVTVSLTQHDEPSLRRFETAVQQHPEIVDCYAMVGNQDYMMRIVVQDPAAYQRFLSEVMMKLPGVANIKSSFTLHEVKNSTRLPVPETE